MIIHSTKHSQVSHITITRENCLSLCLEQLPKTPSLQNPVCHCWHCAGISMLEGCLIPSLISQSPSIYEWRVSMSPSNSRRGYNVQQEDKEPQGLWLLTLPSMTVTLPRSSDRSYRHHLNLSLHGLTARFQANCSM